MSGDSRRRWTKVEGGVTITEEEMAVCRQMGVDQQEYLTVKVQEQASARCRENTGIDLQAEKEKVARMMGIDPAEIKRIEAEEAKKKAAAAQLSPEEVDICHRLGVEPS